MPAHVLLARDGQITWKRASKLIQDRPDPSEILEQIRGMYD